jgi:hypothetical protein
MDKNSPTSISNLKSFPGLYPGPPLKGRGGKGGRKGKRRGLGIETVRRGVVWDRKGGEGMELGGLYRGKGWEGRKRRERRKEGRRKEEGGRR